MVPAVTRRKKRERSTRVRLRSFASKTVSNFVQPTAMFLRLSVLMQEEAGEEMSYGGRKGCLVHT